MHKAKTINNFLSNLKRPKKIINNNENSSRVVHKNILKKEGLLECLNSFLTPRRPYLIKQNLLNIRNKNSKNYLRTIQSKNDFKSPSNNETINKSKSKTIFDSYHKILFRNNPRINNQINSLKFRNNLKNLFFMSNNNEKKNYRDKMGSFSPRNRFRLMKIYETLKFIKTPCSTKESNKEHVYNKEKSNNELNLDFSKEQFFIKKEKNKKYKEKEIKYYRIQNVNSLQFLKIKKEKIENSYIISKRRKEVENDLKEDNMNFMIFSGNKKRKEEKDILNNDSLQEIIYSDDNGLNLKNNIKEEIKDEKKEINYIHKNVTNIDNLENLSNYNKMNIMESCLNKLYFDYSDGNYTNSNNYKYLNNDSQDSNIIINKKIINQKFEKIRKNIKNNEVINEPIINDFQPENNLEPLKIEKNFSNENINNANKNNKISNKNQNQIKHRDIIEDKENINTENIIKTSDIVLSLDNETFTDKNNISIIKKESNNNKKEELIFDNSKQDKLNEIKKINLNLNYLYENKNYVNIQLSNERRYEIKNPKKIISSNKNIYRHSKLIKVPRNNLELLLDKIPKHEKENNFLNTHSVKTNKNTSYKNLRKSKIIEFINKNSAIMPPNDYTTSEQFIYSF